MTWNPNGFNGTGGAGEIMYNDPITQTMLEALRQNVRALSVARFELGGDRDRGIPGINPIAVINFVDFFLTSAEYLGFQYTAFFECRTDNAGTNITPKLRNVTDGVDVTLTGGTTPIVPVTSVAQDFVVQMGLFTPVVNKRYRAFVTKGNDDFSAYAVAYVIRSL